MLDNIYTHTIKTLTITLLCLIIIYEQRLALLAFILIFISKHIDLPKYHYWNTNLHVYHLYPYSISVIESTNQRWFYIRSIDAYSQYTKSSWLRWIKPSPYKSTSIILAKSNLHDTSIHSKALTMSPITNIYSANSNTNTCNLSITTEIKLTCTIIDNSCRCYYYDNNNIYYLSPEGEYKST